MLTNSYISKGINILLIITDLVKHLDPLFGIVVSFLIFGFNFQNKTRWIKMKLEHFLFNLEIILFLFSKLKKNEFYPAKYYF